MDTFLAAFATWWGGLATGVVVGHFFGDWIWQTIKHSASILYQSVKHKIVSE